MRKHIIIAGLGLSLLSGTALAFGPHGSHGPHAAEHVERLADQLDVSAGQRAALREIVDARRPQLRELHDQARANRQAVHALDPAAADYASQIDALAVEHGEIAARMLRLRAEMRAAIHAVLTEEQRQRAAVLPPRREGGRAHRSGPGR